MPADRKFKPPVPGEFRWCHRQLFHAARGTRFVLAVRSASGCFRADRVERRARRDEERAPICAAKRQAAGPLGNLENADRLSFAIVDPDLIACNEDIAGNIRDDRCAAALVEDGTAELAVWLERHAVGAAIIFAGQEMGRALREGG